jgi:ribonuclease HII
MNLKHFAMPTSTFSIIAPDFHIERSHSGVIAGVDEAGRGPWAGPVVAAAVILNQADFPAGLNDSKKLSKIKRERLFSEIQALAKVGVGMADVEEIDRLNILQATKLAMLRAIEALPQQPDLALIDGNQTINAACQTIAIVKGDNKSLSIAAASIIAKVTRDRLMEALHEAHPHYNWQNNAGYGTKAHQEGLAQHGITEHHRRSFKPIAALI